MNSFTKGFLKYFVLPVTTLAATVGITSGTTAHFKNKKIDEAYNNGYNAAVVQQVDYETQLEQYRQLIQEQNLAIQDYTTKLAESNKSNEEKELQIQTLTDTVSTKEALISSLQADIQQKESEITSLTADKTRLETELESAQTTIEENTATISGLQAQVTQLNQKIAELEGQVNVDKSQIESLNSEKTNLLEQITTLTNDNNKKAEEIITLKGNIQTLQSNITSLQTTNELNLSTIKSLNTQIELLNSQISNLQTEIQNNNLSNKQYTDKIEALEKSIKYYESYIKNLENDTQVVATFMFDGSVYNLQIVNKGSFAVVTPPQSTEYKIFNYWTVDGVQQDPSSYALNESTTFVANIAYKYAVLFKNDSVTVDSQIVEKGQHPTNPSNTPQKDGYVFEGWTLNGVDVVDPTQIEISQDTTFTAKWTQLHTVKFNDGQSDTNTYNVKHGEYLTETPTQPTKENYQFDGWTLDGNNVVNLQSVLILEDTTFTAKWTRLWTVTFNDGVNENKTYKVRDKEYLTELPANPVRQDYEFDGWMLESDVIQPKTIQITQDTAFIAKWTRIWTVTFQDGVNKDQTYKVRNDEKLTQKPDDPYKANYVFDGWTQNNDDIVDPLSVNITQDTTFVAKFTRLWTVTFDDGINEEHTTYKVRDGGKLSVLPQNPTKDGFDFVGWTINGEDIVELQSYAVNSDITFTAKYKNSISRVFGENSWDTIAEVSKKISEESMTSQQIEETYGWKVGDEKDTTVGEETITVLILGFNHDDKTSGGKAGISIGMKDCLSTTYAMNSTSTNVGGWDTSKMRTDTMKTLLSQLPADLQKVIKAVNKRASAGNKSTTITTSSDKLWLLCEEEISGAKTYGTGGEGERYEYWTTVKDGTVAANRVKNRSGSAGYWRLRSPHASVTNYFCCVNSSGNFANGYASNAYGVSFCFCI